MTLRITLLVLVTGLFALIWTHDQRPPRQSLPQTASVDPQPNPPAVPAFTQNREFEEMWAEGDGPRSAGLDRELSRYTRGGTDGGNDSQAGVPAIPVSLRGPSPKADRKLGDAEMPWPAGLVPGDYRAVSNTGIVRNLTVTLAELQTRRAGKPEFTTKAIYQSQGKRLRWFFVRVQSESGKTFPVIVQRGTHSIRPAVAPRGTHQYLPAVAEKDRFQELRQHASQIIVGAGQRLFQNMAKSLRDGRHEPWDSVRDSIHPAKVSTGETDENRL